MLFTLSVYESLWIKSKGSDPLLWYIVVMPRKTIALQTGEIYHIYNRGVDKRIIFQDHHDYLRFYNSLAYFNTVEPSLSFRLAKFRHQNSDSIVEVIAYNLLLNHYHLLVKQTVDGGISEYIKRLAAGYTGYFNEKYERSGVLFQGKFKRAHIESDNQFRYVFAYVNENHHVHNLKRETEIYLTSSCHYQGKGVSKIINYCTAYDHEEAKKLAVAIFKKRIDLKEVLE